MPNDYAGIAGEIADEVQKVTEGILSAFRSRPQSQDKLRGQFEEAKQTPEGVMEMNEADPEEYARQVQLAVERERRRE